MANIFILGEVSLTAWSPTDLPVRLTWVIPFSPQILGLPNETWRIVDSVDYVLELCSEATALRQVVMLVWPLLICGSFCLKDRRDKVLSLFDAFQDDYCEDLRAAVSGGFYLLRQWSLTSITWSCCHSARSCWHSGHASMQGSGDNRLQMS